MNSIPIDQNKQISVAKEHAATYPPELHLQNHPYASLYVPTLLHAEFPQAMDIPFGNHETVCHSKVATGDPQGVPCETTFDETKKKLPRPDETPSDRGQKYSKEVPSETICSETTRKTPQPDDTMSAQELTVARGQQYRKTISRKKRKASRMLAIATPEKVPSSTKSQLNKGKHKNYSSHKASKQSKSLPSKHETKQAKREPKRTKTVNEIAVDPTENEDTEWKVFYEQLVAYKTKHETSFVPKGDKTYPQLANWVATQLLAYQKGTMKEEHEHLLVSIGFGFFEPRKRCNATWEAMYQRYQAYQKNHDSVVVFQVDRRDPELGNWMKNQRALHKKGTILEDRKRRLDDVNFDWTVRHWHSWDEMYQKLVAYKKKHGNTNVKLRKNNGYTDQKLANWVRTQRARNDGTHRSNLKDKQRRLLDSLGFEWNRRETLSKEAVPCKALSRSTLIDRDLVPKNIQSFCKEGSYWGSLKRDKKQQRSSTHGNHKA